MFKDWFLYNNKFAAIEHTFNAKGEEVYSYLLLRKKGKELLNEQKETFNSKDVLVDFLKKEKQTHVVLIVNDQQVLSKKIDFVENQNAFQLAYPNLNSQDFYYQNEQAGDSLFIAVSRRSYVDELIAFYAIHKIAVLDVVLGNLPLVGIADVLNADEVYTSNAKIKIEAGKVTDIVSKQFTPEEYSINGLSIASNNLLSLGAIISYYLKNRIYQDKKLFENFKDGVLFKKGFKGVLAFCFLVLLVNFLYFNSYYEKVNRLNSHVELYSNSTEELNVLGKDVKEKERLLNQIQNYASSNLSKHIDEIVERIPSTILLTELNYQPFSGTIKEGKLIKNELKVIKVSGDFKENSDISLWMDSLERLAWVKEVSKVSITNTSKGSKFYFSIVIKDEL